ncbi:hypothetical protein HNP84_000169 [Thermocatellispora tengchongensis]|uniref:Putative zinc-finger domain-containing protein n=1 Tax=Thermocatellispora tengchongensis TaxID=1073253 RepID=A0A840NXV0_9ACTN|nr:zf-HC2 domain-containing protein [Thermocatellispora tengchongensis]MBB5130481.1 hypothetical protein [Thermocatellispora tengchongensis]
MTGDTHYDLEILAELAEGLLDAATAKQVREHLAVCDPCGERLADLAAVREVLAATPTPAMPMGVALRIDQALAAEAERRPRTAVALAEAPDWDRLMAGSPWETAAKEAPPWEAPAARAPEPERPAEPAAPWAAEEETPSPWETRRRVRAEEPEPAFLAAAPVPEPEAGHEPEARPLPLGVVADDGTIVPAKRRKAGASRRRRWLMPVASAAAACAVIGTAAVGTTMFAASPGPSNSPAPIAAPSKTMVIGPAYKITETDFNYSNRDLRGTLSDYFAPAPVQKGEDEVDAKLTRCVNKVAGIVGDKPFQVDRAYYLGQEATIMLFWKDRAANTVQVRVLGPECKNLRKPGLAKW